MALTAPTAPGIPGAAPVTALPNNGGAPTVPQNIPTKAPTGQTSTSQPQSNPVAIVSSNTAADHVNNTILPAMNNAQNAIQQQNQNNAVASNPYSVQPGETTDAYNARVAQFNASKTPTPTPTPTPEQQIANTPDSGNQWLYAPDGSKIQNPVNEPIPQGYSMTDPTQAPSTPVTGSAQLDTGAQIQKYSDGTYGRLDASGKYAGPASAQDYQDAQTVSGLKTSLLQVVNGTYPLTPTQQAQITGIQAQFAQLIKEQQVANANLTGGTTVAENLYGMGNSLTGLGAIKATVDQGIAKISDLNDKMNSAVAQMTQGFQDQNMKALQAAYDLFNNAQKDKQAEIDKLQANATAAAKDARDFNFNVQKEQSAQADNLRTYNLAVQREIDAQSNSDRTYGLDVQKEQDQVAQNAITNKRENALAASTLKTQAIDRAKTQEEINQLRGTGGTGMGVGVVGTNSLGVTSVSQQKAFLQSVAAKNPGLALQIKAAANYTLDPKVFPLAKGARDNFDALVRQYDPTYDSGSYAAKAAYQKQLSSGTLSQTVNSANKVVNHLSSLLTSLDSLGNLPIGGGKFGINDTRNFLEANNIFNPSAASNKQANLSRVKTEANGVADEMAKFFKGTGVSDVSSIDSWKSLVSSDLTPGSQEGLKQGAIALFTGQLDTLYAQYESNMGHPPPIGAVLQPETITKLQKLGVDVTPYIQGTPMGTVQQIAQHGTPDQQQAIKTMINQGVSDEDILQVLGE